MPRDTCSAPAILPLFSTSGASRTSTTSVLPLPIISRASAGVIFGTAAFAASSICFTLDDIAHSSFTDPATVGPVPWLGGIQYCATSDKCGWALQSLDHAGIDQKPV